jgi:hypothetical protein
MDQSVHADDPLPPRLRWFAPWRWFARLSLVERWTVVLIAVILSIMLYGDQIDAILVWCGFPQLAQFGARGSRGPVAGGRTLFQILGLD